MPGFFVPIIRVAARRNTIAATAIQINLAKKQKIPFNTKTAGTGLFAISFTP